MTQPADYPSRTVCPECVQGKHGNCDGTAWDMLGDFPTDCACADVKHDEELLGGRDPMIDSWAEFVTSLGCKIRITPAPEHLGEGVMLTLMVDTRFAEVYLDPYSRQALREALG